MTREAINSFSELSGFAIDTPEADIRLFEELVIFNFAAAVGIFIDKHPNTDDAKKIVSGFVDEVASKVIKSLIERDPSFRERYDKRLRIYLASFAREDVVRRVGAILLNGLGVRDNDNPHVTSPSQILMQERVGAALLAPTETFDKIIHTLIIQR